MDIEVTFPGGMRVDASFEGQVVRCDQAPARGGEGTAPEPYDLFLASLAACAGTYVLAFCRKRDIPMDGVRVVQRTVNDPDKKRLAKVIIEVILPPDFPEQYVAAVRAAAAACKVKKTMADPPEFEVTAERRAEG